MLLFGKGYVRISDVFISIYRTSLACINIKFQVVCDYTLILYPLLGTVKLFNIRRDPCQTKNLALAEEDRGRISSLIKKLQAEQKESGDPLDLAEFYAECFYRLWEKWKHAAFIV